jgi:hypothetical protein
MNSHYALRGITSSIMWILLARAAATAARAAANRG